MTPNVLLIVPTPLSAAHVSCYGYERLTTPNLDALAERGARYEYAYGTSNWTAPGYGSVLTGLYPSAHGVFGHNAALDESVETMATVLGRHGYQTVGFVNHVHAGRLKGFDRGFDEFFEFRRVWEAFGVLRKGDIVGPSSRGLRKTGRTAVQALANYFGLIDKGARDTTQRAMRWIDGRDRTRPFLMVLEYHQLHAPFGAPWPGRYRFLKDAGLRRKDVRSLGHHLRRHAGRQQATQRQQQVLDALYDGEVHYLDRWLGRLFDHLDHTALTDETAVIVAAPHGLDTAGHGYLYEPTIRVPMIIVYPERVPQRTVVEGLAETNDVFPTVLDLAEAPGPGYDLQGQSLLPITGSGSRRRFAVSELSRVSGERSTQYRSGRRTVPVLPPPRHDQPDAAVDSYIMRAYRSGDHKYVATTYGAEELYDLRADPGEHHNLTEERPALAEALRRDLGRWASSFEARPGVREPDDIEASLIDELRATGYRL